MLKKRKLSLDELSIESFETVAPESGRGTVRAHASGMATCVDMGCNAGTEYTNCFGGCGGGDTAGLSCACETQDCTANPNQFQCIDSVHYCYDTQQAACLE